LAGSPEHGSLMSELFLVRHAQASFGTDNYDRLSDLGHRQARWLGEHFRYRELGFDQVICGSMVRHRETVAAVLQGMGREPGEIETDPAWNEFDFEAIVAAYLEEHQESLNVECEDTISAINEIIENVRRISRDLMPSILEDLGLVASIQWLVENFSKQHDIEVSLDMEDIDPLFPREIQINLYRICQESLTNVSKHADANRVSVTVGREEESMVFRVRDNGKGFDSNIIGEKGSQKRGVGLMAMKERMYIMGGEFDVNSRAGEGTEIVFKVPIGEKEV